MDEAFRNTNFIITDRRLIDTNFIIKIDDYHPLLDALILPQTKWLFITAWNPLPIVLSKAENTKRNKELELKLDQKEYPHYNAIGQARDNSWAEESLFVLDVNLEEAYKLADLFGQMAFVYGESGTKAQLIYTKK